MGSIVILAFSIVVRAVLFKVVKLLTKVFHAAFSMFDLIEIHALQVASVFSAVESRVSIEVRTTCLSYM